MGLLPFPLKRNKLGPLPSPPLKNDTRGLARGWSVYVRPITDPWPRCGWCTRTAPLLIDIKRCSSTRGAQPYRCKGPPSFRSCSQLLAQQAKSLLAPKRNQTSTSVPRLCRMARPRRAGKLRVPLPRGVLRKRTCSRSQER